MDDLGPSASIIIFIILIIIDFIFYGFGSALQSINRKEVEKKITEKDDKRSIRLKAIIENPIRYINTVQFVVTLINIIMGACYLGIWLRFMKKVVDYQAIHEMKIFASIGFDILGIVTVVITTLLFVYVLLTIGVLVPKKIAAKYPEKWAYTFITLIYYITKILIPFTGIVTLTTNAILRVFGIRWDDYDNDVTEEEIISMVYEGHEQGVLQASEAEMITNIFEFGDKEAKDIMINRQNICAIEATMSLKDSIDYMLKERNSRYPVYLEHLDQIIGILHLKDAMRIYADNKQLEVSIQDIKGLIREVAFIPETRNIDVLFKNMQSTKTQMVMVIDEYGQTTGLIAMEDILEEIVGNIQDEYDDDHKHIKEMGTNEYIMDGVTPLEDLEEILQISFKDEEFDTLNGFLISKMEKIPDDDEDFEIDVEGYHFKVTAVKNKMIQTVFVTKKEKVTCQDTQNLPT